MSYVTPFPDWFVIYGMAPSNWWDAAGKRWYRLRLGWNKNGSQEQQKASFCCYLWAWEDPYTTVRQVPLEIPVFHAQLVPPEFGAGQLWVIGDDAAGRDISMPILEATEQGKVLALDDLPFPIITAAEHAKLPKQPETVKDDLWRRRTK